jgi:hypothetical protein
MYPRSEAIYISPNEAALDNAYQYQPVDRGMGFALGLFSTLVNVGLQLTMATIQTVSTIHKANVESKAAKQEEHKIERAVEAERVKQEEEKQKYADIAAQIAAGSGGTATTGGGTIPATSYVTGALGGISTNTLLIVGALGVATILILKKRKS